MANVAKFVQIDVCDHIVYALDNGGRLWRGANIEGEYVWEQIAGPQRKPKVDDWQAWLKLQDNMREEIAAGRCPDGLLPDGPVCPACGEERAASGVDGGTWVHKGEGYGSTVRISGRTKLELTKDNDDSGNVESQDD